MISRLVQNCSKKVDKLTRSNRLQNAFISNHLDGEQNAAYTLYSVGDSLELLDYFFPWLEGFENCNFLPQKPGDFLW